MATITSSTFSFEDKGIDIVGRFQPTPYHNQNSFLSNAITNARLQNMKEIQKLQHMKQFGHLYQNQKKTTKKSEKVVKFVPPSLEKVENLKNEGPQKVLLPDRYRKKVERSPVKREKGIVIKESRRDKTGAISARQDKVVGRSKLEDGDSKGEVASVSVDAAVALRINRLTQMVGELKTELDDHQDANNDESCSDSNMDEKSDKLHNAMEKLLRYLPNIISSGEDNAELEGC